jgi:hypothetical protein
MKHKLLTIVMIIVGLTLPLQINAKGKPASVAMLKDANGETVGRVIGMDLVHRPYVLTDQGYRTAITLPMGWVVTSLNWPIYYESTDCTGTGYIEVPKFVGAVFVPQLPSETTYDLGMILYTPNDAQSITVNMNSAFYSFDPLNCVPYVVTGEGYPVYPNDPTITGIKNTVYSTPMVIE